MNYSGYQFYLDLNDDYDPTDFDAICDGTRVYTLAPPGDITVNGTTYNATNPMSTGHEPATVQDRTGQKICSKNNTFLSKNGDDTNGWTDWLLQFITGDRPTELTNAMPAGDWVLSRDGEEIARFEFRNANPIDADGKPIVFVPAVQLLKADGSPVNAGEKIEKVAIKWYRWDSTVNDYVEISGSDRALVQNLTGGFDFSMADLDGKDGNHAQANWRRELNAQNDVTIDVSSAEFYYNYSGSEQYNATYLGISYQFGGQGFRFSWRSDAP